MEKARGLYTMWRKRKSNLESSRLKSFDDDSWEEQAFAEDAAGSMWPPRSYTCSFCRREFRSAQALGGHMNVHRRDRARLKQGVEDENNHRSDRNNNCFAFSEQSQSSCTLVFSPNPDPDHPCIIDLTSRSSTTCRVSALPRKESSKHQELSFFPSFSFSSPSIQELTKRSADIPSLRSWPISFGDKYYKIPTIEGEKKTTSQESGCRGKLDLVNTDLSVSLNLVIRRSCSSLSGGKEELDRGCKRRRITEELVPSQPSISNSSSSCKNELTRPEEPKQRANSKEDLDLELRLGANPPKVIH